MTKLFTCTGTAVAITTRANGSYYDKTPFQYSHVVQAETVMEAEDKLFDFYLNKRDGLTTYEVDSVAVWDMIV